MATKTRGERLTGRQYAQIRLYCQTQIRHRHPADFQEALADERARGISTRTSYKSASTRLFAKYPDEYAELRDYARGLYAGKVSLRKKPKLRDEIDQLDALILFERGMTASEIATYDGCTQSAVVKVLAPMLKKRRSPFAGWWETNAPNMSVKDISEALGCHDSQVYRALATSA